MSFPSNTAFANGGPAAHGSASRQRLREATADLHARVDGLFPMGIDTLDTYRGYVLGMHRFTVDMEIATARLPRQSSWLAQDLVTLSLPPLVARGVRRPLVDHTERLGWEYVMAGSSRGARQLVRDVRRLGVQAGHGACFLERHAADQEDWAALLGRLGALDAADAQRMARAEAGARDAFSHVHACMLQAFDVLSLPSDTRHAV